MRLRMVVGWLLLLAATGVAADPRVLYTDISSGPNKGGEGDNGAYLSIFGQGFGTDLAKVKVYVGAGEVARYMYLGRSLGRPDVQQLSVQLGPKTTSGPIKVVAAGAASNTNHTFTVRAGNFYFISPQGDNDAGRVNDIARPYRSANYVHGLRNFRAGDFIIALPGTYVLADTDARANADSWLRAWKSGTNTAPLAFLGYPGGKVEVQHSHNIRIISNYESIAHWVVGNFAISLTDCQGPGEIVLIGNPTTPEVCRDSKGTLRGKASAIKLVNMDADGHSMGGFCSGGDGLVEIGYSENVKVIGLALHHTSPRLAESESAHAIYLAARQEGTEVGWNTVHHIPGTRAVVQVHQDAFGDVCWGKKYLTNIRIHDNLLHDLAGQAILLDGGTGDVVLDNNLIYNNQDRRYNDIIALRGGGGVLNAKLYHNVVCADPRVGGDGHLLGIGFSYLPERVTLHNNIFCVTAAGDRYVGTEGSSAELEQWWRRHVTSDHNLWYGSRHGKPAFASPRELDEDPLFVDARAGDFTLKPASVARRAARLIRDPAVIEEFDARAPSQTPDLGVLPAR